MSSLSIPPPLFLKYNSQSSKNLVIVVDIDGLPLITNKTVYRYAKFGDPDIFYGEDGLYYGYGVGAVGGQPGERQQKNLLMLDGGSLTISQKLEAEQGRGSISTLSLTFLDKDGYMTQVVSPGVVVDEILGRQVRVWIGYTPTSWPSDYYVVWRGRVGSVQTNPGRVTLGFVDPNVARKQQVFFCGKTTLNGAITDSQTTINVGDNGEFFEKIPGPGGPYDIGVRCLLKIDDEFIEYQQGGAETTGFGTNQFLNVLRGVDPLPLETMSVESLPAAHDDEASVDAYLLLTDHAMDMALKIMLSGWNGPFLSDQGIYSFVTTDDLLVTSSPTGVVLPENVDAIRDLGISVGDYLTVSGATTGGNNGQCIVTGFIDLSSGQTNRVVVTNKTFTAEYSGASTVVAVRSKYDVYPILAGCKLPGWEVDIGTFEFFRNTFLNASFNKYMFLLSDGESGKTFIENQILLPVGAYSLTRQGKISMGFTKPAIADQRSQTIDVSSVVDPTGITVQRAMNNRKFFNEIDWSYDFDEIGNARSLRNGLDADSLDLVGISSILPIEAKGARSQLGFLNVVATRENYLLTRYANGAVLISLTVPLGLGNLIEPGDIVALVDEGNLKIPNFSDGTRNFGTQLMEVIGRDLDLKGGMCRLQLEGGVGALATDRFATIAPSSLITGASTTSRLVITESFGAVFPSQEYKKWQDYIGLNIRVHSADWLRDETVQFTGFDPAEMHAMLIFPPLSFTPQANMIIDLAQYPTNTDPLDQRLAKLVHAFVDPTVPVVSGTSQTVFTVSGGNITKFAVGQKLLLHDVTYARMSPEVTIIDITSNTITVDTAVGFFPDASIKIELIGFADGGRPYRMV